MSTQTVVWHVTGGTVLHSAELPASLTPVEVLLHIADAEDYYPHQVTIPALERALGRVGD